MAATGFETITVANTAIGFTAAKLATAENRKHVYKAFITNATAQIRFCYDGTDPTSTVGHLMEAGDSLVLEGLDNLSKFKAIRTGTTSGVLSVTYETE